MSPRESFSLDCSIDARMNGSNQLHEVIVGAASPETLRGNITVLRALGYTPIGTYVMHQQLSGARFIAAAVAPENYLEQLLQ